MSPLASCTSSCDWRSIRYPQVFNAGYGVNLVRALADMGSRSEYCEDTLKWLRRHFSDFDQVEGEHLSPPPICPSPLFIPLSLTAHFLPYQRLSHPQPLSTSPILIYYSTLPRSIPKTLSLALLSISPLSPL